MGKPSRLDEPVVVNGENSEWLAIYLCPVLKRHHHD